MKSMRQLGIWRPWLGIFCILPSMFCASRGGAAVSSDLLIQTVEQRYNKVRTLTVSFVEQYSVQGHRHPLESGLLTLRKQGKMRWDYSKPSGKVFVSDGKLMYLYTPADNKVETLPLKDTEDMRAPLAFLLGHLDLKKEFRDFSVRPDGDRFWMEAESKNARMPYEKIQMLISPGDGQINELIVVGRDDSRLQFELRDEKLNPVVNDSIFAFKIPPGAEVVRAVEYSGEGR